MSRFEHLRHVHIVLGFRWPWLRLAGLCGAPQPGRPLKKSRFRVSLYLITLCIVYYTISNNSLKEEIMDYTANALDLFRQLKDEDQAAYLSHLREVSNETVKASR